MKSFKYLGSLLTNQNSIQGEIKCRLQSGNSCYFSVQTFLFSQRLSKNLKMRIYKTIILPVVLYRCETWSPTLMEEHWLRLFGSKRDENVEWRWLHNEEPHSLYLHIM